MPLIRSVLAACLGAALAASAAAQGEATPAGDASVATLESARDWVRSTTLRLARGIDSWFGDLPFEPGGKVADGRLELRSTWRRDEGFDLGLRFKARLELPNLRRRAYAYFGRDNEREVVTDRPDAFSRQDRLLAEVRREDQSLFAGLGVPLGDDVELRAGVRRGYEVYAQARYKAQWPLGERSAVAFRETLFWTVVDGFGSTTAVSLEHAVSPHVALRWLSAGTVAQKTDGLEWASSVGAYRSFDGDRLLSAEALIQGRTQAPVAVDDYGLRLKWLQPVYRDWLFGEFSVGHFWPRESAQSPRERTWAFGVGVQMWF